MRPDARIPRPCARMLALVLGLLVASAADAASMVSSISVGGDGHTLEIEITASGPLGYLLSEGHAPFTLSLVFTGASLGFADTRRTFAGDGLVELQARTLTREGSTLARLDLRFAREAPYTISRDESRVRIRAEMPGPRSAVVIGATSGASPAPAPGPTSPGPTSPAPALVRAPPPDATPAVVRAVHPESSARAARLAIDVEGAAAIKTVTLGTPFRIVVDFQNARVEPKTRTIPVSRGLLRQVRISQKTATVVRVVCDLAHPAPYRLEPTPQGLVVHLGEGVR